jgi:LytS/YehU family sensor histidine kinase
MIKDKKLIFSFILVITISLFFFLLTLGIFSKELKVSLFFQFFINLPICIAIGFIDFGIINGIHKKFKHKSTTFRIITNLILTVSSAILLSIATNYILSVVSTFHFNLLQASLPLALWNSLIVLVIELFFYNQRQTEAEKKLAITEKEKIQYQYETLKTQINPHFLFNSLNVLSSLTYQDPEKANLFTKKMSGVYRYLLLTNSRSTVTLQEELSFLKSYLFLEQIRFEDALFVNITNEEAHLSKKVIPVSIQLLVENAIKHNIATTKSPLKIQISITDKGIVVSNNLQLRSSVDKGGVGLENLQKQYALHNKKIDILQKDMEFIVKPPFIT